jgi:hypothetical protein
MIYDEIIFGKMINGMHYRFCANRCRHCIDSVEFFNLFCMLMHEMST